MSIRVNDYGRMHNIDRSIYKINSRLSLTTYPLPVEECLKHIQISIHGRMDGSESIDSGGSLDQALLNA